MWSSVCPFKVLLCGSNYYRVLSYVRIVTIRCFLCVLYRVRVVIDFRSAELCKGLFRWINKVHAHMEK